MLYKVVFHHRKEIVIMKQKTYVYILNKQGKPLMPTTRCGKVRKLLKEGKAVVVRSNPFTIRLKYDTDNLEQHYLYHI